jgi:hypothetical protein
MSFNAARMSLPVWISAYSCTMRQASPKSMYKGVPIVALLLCLYVSIIQPNQPFVNRRTTGPPSVRKELEELCRTSTPHIGPIRHYCLVYPPHPRSLIVLTLWLDGVLPYSRTPLLHGYPRPSISATRSPFRSPLAD